MNRVLLPIDIGDLDLPAVTPDPASHSDCIHRGDVVELRDCGTCSRPTKIKVFACAVPTIRRCQLGANIIGTHSCEGCPSKLLPAASTP